MTQTTIKQHLTDAIYKNDLLCKLGNGDGWCKGAVVDTIHAALLKARGEK